MLFLFCFLVDRFVTRLLSLNDINSFNAPRSQERLQKAMNRFRKPRIFSDSDTVFDDEFENGAASPV